jgi:hypothetical protein
MRRRCPDLATHCPADRQVEQQILRPINDPIFPIRFEIDHVRVYQRE